MGRYEVIHNVRAGHECLELQGWKKMYWIQLEGIRVPAYEPSLLPLENLGVVFIVFCNVKGYTHTICKEYSYCSQQIILLVNVFHGDILINVPKMCISKPTF